MSMVIEPIVHFNAHVFSLWIIFGKFRQDVDLEFSCVSVLFYILDDFDCENLALLKIFTSDNFAEGSLTEL